MAARKYTTEKVHEGYMRVNSCGRQWLGDRDYNTVRPKGRVDYSLFYLAKGKGSFSVEGKNYPFSQGSLLLYFPQVPHRYAFRKEDGSKLLWSHFSGSCCECLEILRSDTPKVITLRDPKEFEGQFEKMVEAHYNRATAGDFLCDSFMPLLLALLLQSSDSEEGREKKHVNEQLEQVLSLMHLRFYQPIDLEKYAAMCHLSQDRFIRVFKAYTGDPPYRYQLKIRIQRAVEMLENSAITVSECAESVGFGDNAYFCRIFKKFTGHPPSYYKS